MTPPDTTDPKSPLLRITPAPTDAELAAIVAAVAVGIAGSSPPEHDTPIGRHTNRWAAAGRREAMHGGAATGDEWLESVKG